MSCSLEKVLADAKRLSSRLKEHDSSTENIISYTEQLQKRLQSMKEYKENSNDLNNLIATMEPMKSITWEATQENSQIVELQEENRYLTQCLLEHQCVLELIMSKYRRDVSQLIRPNASAELPSSSDMSKLQESIRKVSDAADVMRKAGAMDEAATNERHRLIAQYELENRSLRELLRISSTYRNNVDVGSKESQTSVASVQDSNATAASVTPESNT